MTTLREILEKARAAKQRLPPNEAAVMFAAVVRLAAAQKATVRARLVQIDDAGGLHLAPLDERIAETEPGYEAPELLAAGAPRKNEPRVQVYAAGALGYELLTGRTPPQPGGIPGTELAGPLGDVVRMALAKDRRERFGDLAQLHQAVEGVQPRPPAEGERNIFAALRMRFTRPPPEKEAVAKVIDRLHQVEAQTSALGKTQLRLEATLRQVQETVERFEDGQRRASEAQRRRGSSVAPGLASGAVAALAVLGVAWALGMVAAPGALRPAPSPATAPSAALPAPPPEPPIPAKETAKESPKEGLKELAKEVTRAAAKEAPPPVQEPERDAAAAESDDAGTVAETADAGGEPADASVAAVEDAGAPAKVATAPAPAPAAEKKRRPAQSNQAAMQHALAVSELRHGETALEQGQTDEAVESFRAALENEPALAAAFRGLGTAYSMQGKNAEALQAYEKYLKLAPKAPDAADIRNTVKQLRARAGSGGR